MQHKLTWYGHANFLIQTPNLSVLIDPWFEGNPSCKYESGDLKKLDLVLVTHDHADHMGQCVDICLATGASVGANVETAGKIARAGVPQDQVLNGIGFNIGGTVKFKDIEITMTQAFHSTASGSPVGYIIRLEDGFTLYHAGDTGIFQSMAIWGNLFDIDLAMLPIGGVFTMDPRQAAYACSLLKCRRVVPMHWGTFPVLEQNTAGFAEYLKKYSDDTVLIDMKPGQFATLEKGVMDCACADL